ASGRGGVPVVLMGAMAGGVPVVATRVGGVAELVEDGVTGRVVSPGSSEDLASALAATWDDPRAAAARAEAATRRVRAEFDVRDSGRGMRALFERYLLGARVVADETAGAPVA